MGKISAVFKVQDRNNSLYAVNLRNRDKPPPVGWYTANYKTQDRKKVYSRDFGLVTQPISAQKNYPREVSGEGTLQICDRHIDHVKALR